MLSTTPRSHVFVAFSGSALALFLLQSLSWVQAHLLMPFNVLIAQACHWIIQLWDPTVRTYAEVIWSTRHPFAISIDSGCNGVLAAIFLSSAMLAFPCRWTAKLIGLILGNLLMQGLNLVRIISLFYLGEWGQAYFDLAHLYLWQILILLALLSIFLIWMRWSVKYDVRRVRF